MGKQGRFKGLLPPIIVSTLLLGMFLSFLRNVDKRHTLVIEDINNERAVVLSPECNTKTLSEIIYNDGYAETKEDADFIASVLINRQKKEGRLPSLFALQKRAFGQVAADTAADKGVLSKKLLKSYEILGQDRKPFPLNMDSHHLGNGKMMVTVFKKVESSKWWKKLLKIEDKVPCAAVPVKLSTHFRDSLGNVCEPVVLGFDTTDSKGIVVFEGLDTAASYSVLPVKKGFEYGSSKGTIDGKWRMGRSGPMEFVFEEKEHFIPLFDNATLKQIKTERTILARSPQDYKAVVVKWFVYVMLAWWALCLYMIVRKKRFNGALLASCMFLTGLCVLMMFSMQDPLNDELHGITMGKGVLIGLAVCLLFQEVNFVKLYQNNSKVGFDIPTNIFRWFFKPYRQKVAGLATTLKSDAGILKKMLAMVLVLLSLPFLLLDLLQITRLGKPVDRLCVKLPKGIGWLVLALLLTALLWTPFGQSVGGMKVNLNLFGLVFQPSEIAKYLILFFMAAFFTQQADTIIAYSQPNRIKMIGSKLKTLLWIVLGLSVLMAMYIALGDMGPGLVIGITFILLYSLIKSKVILEHLDEKDRWKRIFTCDFAMLVYGVLSFAVFLIVGYRLENMLLFGVLWFVFWVALGYVGFKKQLFESAVLMNAIVFVFIFGGQILGSIPALKDSSTVERFEARTRMCVNSWGELDIEHLGKDAEPVSNTQVAEGLWALATGGVKGQGWGGGRPSLIPAFHTDMILSSIGEQLGWIGLLAVVVALAVLLRKMAVVGYEVGHPFAFYLCLGFAIVIGVQFFIIAFGSSGMIPLTGVTVPFLSFGRVSMILNLAAFGIVLSFCNNIREDETAVSASVRQKSVEQYSYPIAMVTMAFLFFAVSTLFVWQYYQLWKRDSTLIRPVYALSNQGVPMVEYNPRIALLVNNMYAGRIYDRNSILLATSDKTEIVPEEYVSLGVDKEVLSNKLKRPKKRYYPLGEQMFFMVGDNVPFSYSTSDDEEYPMGYLADHRHMSYLRGYDNILRDDYHNPVEVILSSERYRENSFMVATKTVSKPTIRDYTPLLKYLKDGIDGEEVARHNDEVERGKYDIHLTVDAALQIDLQNSIAKYMVHTFKNWNDFNLMRASAVVLDAENGDLLASANYPLPDYVSIYDQIEHKYSYSDYYRDNNWKAYTDRDLGTAFMKAPGSTAKVMSAMAGLRKNPSLSNQKYYISKENAVEGKKDDKGNIIEASEPISKSKNDSISMHDAIVRSSNCYFINLVNDKDLYADLETIYSSVGARVGNITPYYYTKRENGSKKTQFHNLIEKNRAEARRRYERFVSNGYKGSMIAREWAWAWGHGGLEASPLVMARVASAVVNEGKMPITQYVKEASLRSEGTIPLLNSKEASILKGFMQDESKKHPDLKCWIEKWNSVGGKTGTAERTIKRYDRNGRKVSEDVNDCWYMCFVETGSRRFAVVVRIERAGKGKGHFAAQTAVPLVGDVVLNCLDNYLINN